MIRNLLLFACLFLLAAACKKGDTGPAGPVGEPGAKIYSGAGVPAVSLGKPGDFYFDTQAKNMYGPRDEKGWGAPVSLSGATGVQGSQGQPGQQGSVILSGNGGPGAEDGRNGDYYLDKLTALMYGPKSDGGWGIPVNLKGPKGDKGDPGNAGAIATPWKKLKVYSETNETLQLYDSLPLAAFGVADLEALGKKGIVLVYSKPSLLLPYSFTGNISGEFYTIDSWYNLLFVGNVPSIFVMVKNTRPDLEVLSTYQYGKGEYRIVYIPISQIAAASTEKKILINNALYTPQQLKAMPYEQAAALLNLSN